MVFICIFTFTSEVQHLFMSLWPLGIFIFFPCELLNPSLCSFFFVFCVSFLVVYFGILFVFYLFIILFIYLYFIYLFGLLYDSNPFFNMWSDYVGFPGAASGKEPACQCRRQK